MGKCKYLVIFILLAGCLSLRAAAGNQNFEEQPREYNHMEIDFQNGDFEKPDMYSQELFDKINANSKYEIYQTLEKSITGKVNYFHMDLVDLWYTKVVDPVYEQNKWHEYIQICYDGYSGAEAHDGSQFAELNADVPGILYQICDTEPGQKVYWEFYHRGRHGVDQMEFLLNDVQQKHAVTGQVWKRYYGEYTVPDGQTETVFAFKSGITSNGSTVEGNFLDSIRLFYPSFLQITKQAQTPGIEDGKAYALIGDIVTYTIEIENIGEADTSRTVLTDILADGVLLIEDSIEMVYVDNGNGGTESVIDPSDTAYFDAVTDTLTIFAGQEISGAVITDDNGNEQENKAANGTRGIARGDRVIITFDVVVTGNNTNFGDLIKNQVKVVYNDLGFEEFNKDENGKVLDEENYSEVVSFQLRQKNELVIEKQTTEKVGTAQSFVFRIEYCPGALPYPESVNYAVVTVADGEDIGKIKLAELYPGTYRITELNNNWNFMICDLSSLTQSVTLNGDTVISKSLFYTNEPVATAWVSGKGEIVNTLSSID